MLSRPLLLLAALSLCISATAWGQAAAEAFAGSAGTVKAAASAKENSPRIMNRIFMDRSPQCSFGAGQCRGGLSSLVVPQRLQAGEKKILGSEDASTLREPSPGRKPWCLSQAGRTGGICVK